MEILVINGGGMLGISAAAFLARLDRDHPGIVDRFGLLAGDSTGAVITCCLGYGKSPIEVLDLYARMGPDLFRKNWQPWRGWLGCTRYKAEGMRDAFAKVFGNTPFNELRHDVMIWAAMLSPENGIRHWKSWRSGPRHSTPVVAALMASAAPWTYFPPVEIDGSVYFDGGHACNNGSLYAVAEAVRMGASLDAVKVLNITLREPEKNSKEAALDVTSLLGGASIMPSGVIEFTEAGIEYSSEQLLGDRYCQVCMNCSGTIDETRPEKLDAMSREGVEAYELNADRVRDWLAL